MLEKNERLRWKEDESVGNIRCYKKENKKMNIYKDKIILYNTNQEKMFYHERKKKKKIPIGEIKIIKEIRNIPLPDKEAQKDFADIFDFSQRR